MSWRRAYWTVGLTALQAALLAATYFWDGLGARTWHHVASLGGVLLLAAVIHRPLARSRRFLAVGVLATTSLAAVSGFYLLYWKEGIRADGYQDWGVFWHVLWSWMAAVFFVQHTWINRVAFGAFFRRSLVRAGPATAHMGAYALSVGALAVTWSPSGRVWFDGGNYVPLTLYTWAAVLVPAYAMWLALRRRWEHWPVRRALDLALVPLAGLAVATGFPLVFDGPFDAAGLKYASKYWHVASSILFSVVVFIHSVQAWAGMRAHWRNYGRPGRRAV